MTRTVSEDESDEGGTLILATLKRGKSYKHQFQGEYHDFKREVPKPVSEALADELEELIERVPTEDGDIIEKDTFEIDRDATPATLEPERKRVRLRITREEVDDTPVRRKPKLRVAPAKKAVAPGFAKRSAG